MTLKALPYALVVLVTVAGTTAGRAEKPKYNIDDVTACSPDAMRLCKDKLPDLGAGRLADMDAAGITMQVLSVSGPGSDPLPPDRSVAWARHTNDVLARAVAEHPGRYAGFAHLPLAADPKASADELERCVRDLKFVGTMVNGMTDGKFLDDPSFEPVLARAERLGVPIYLHPGLPPEAVRKAYYDGLPEPLGMALAAFAYGWHAETAVHVLRLIFAGVLDRHPKLNVIIGHMGEYLPMTLARTDEMMAPDLSKRSARSVAQQLRDQVYVTTAGLFTVPPLQLLLATFGIDRVMFSVDYPFSHNAQGRAFLDALPLAPADVAKIAHGNADRLLGLAG